MASDQETAEVDETQNDCRKEQEMSEGIFLCDGLTARIAFKDELDIMGLDSKGNVIDLIIDQDMARALKPLVDQIAALDNPDTKV